MSSEMTLPGLFSRLNPILQKEIRATFRTWRFGVTFIICLTCLGALILLMVISQESTNRIIVPAQLGRSIFITFVGGLGIVTWFLLPAYSCTAFTSEREGETYDLLMTTALRPWDLVWGKLLASFAYVYIFYIGCLPLVCLSFLFGGVTPIEIIASYLALTLAAFLVVSISLMFSAVYTTSRRAVSATYAVLGFSSMILIPLGAQAVQFPMPLRTMLAQVPLSVYVTAVFLYLSLVVLCLLVTINALKSPSENKSTNLRIFFATSSLVLTVLALWILVDHLQNLKAVQRPALLVAWLVLCSGFLLSFPFLFCSEPPRRSRRIESAIAQLPAARKPLARLLAPGAFSGYAFSMLWSTCLLAITAAALWSLLDISAPTIPLFSKTDSLGKINALFALPTAWSILLFYASLCLFLSTLGVKTLHIRGVVLALLILSNIVPTFFFALQSRSEKTPSFNVYFMSPVFASWSMILTPSGLYLADGTNYRLILPANTQFRSDGKFFFTRLPLPFLGEGVKGNGPTQEKPLPGQERPPTGKDNSRSTGAIYVPQFLVAIPFYFLLSGILLALTRRQWKRQSAEPVS